MEKMTIICPHCKCPISGRFDLESFCPYCGYEYGEYAKICLDCDTAWFPVYLYCPECGKKTGVLKIDELLSIELQWRSDDGEEFEDAFQGVTVSTLAYGSDKGGYKTIKESYPNYKNLVEYTKVASNVSKKKPKK